MKKLNWEEVYQLPLVKSAGTNNYFSQNHTLSLAFINARDTEIKEIVQSINEDIPCNIKGLYNVGCEFYIAGELKFVVRGWGKLTGVGGYNLSVYDATEVQDKFINYITSKLIMKTKRQS